MARSSQLLRTVRDRDESVRPAELDLSPLTGLVGYGLRRAHLAAFRNFNRHFETADIRPTQLGVLNLVAANPGAKPSAVGAALGIKRANLVPLLAGLEERGLLERRPASSDRRSLALHLTDSGEALFADLLRREAEHEAELVALIGETGRRQLVTLLAKVQAACDPGPEAEEEG